jgi:hypothetical protein
MGNDNHSGTYALEGGILLLNVLTLEVETDRFCQTRKACDQQEAQQRPKKISPTSVNLDSFL